jgi:hypothetical protein
MRSIIGWMGMRSKEYARRAFLKSLIEHPLCCICGLNPHASNDRRCNPCRREYLRGIRLRDNGGWYKRLTPLQAHKRRVRARIYISVKRGKTIRRPCELCGSLAEAHHYKGYDDKNTYAVRWLCRKHHRELEIKSLTSGISE